MDVTDGPLLDDGVVRLRPIDKADSTLTRSWRNDPEIWARTMGFRLPITESMEEKWFDALAADNGLTRVVFGIELTAEQRLIGMVFLNAIDWPSGTAAFGMLIGSADQRGKGYGRRALHLATGYATRALALRKLTLQVVATNDAANHLYLSDGWITEGRQSKQFLVDGQVHDVILMGRFLD